VAWIIGIHAFAACVLGIYAAHQVLLLVLCARAQPTSAINPVEDSAQALADAALPAITVQLPMYNERYMAQRVIAAVLAQAYPRDRLHIQVLDDSTDDTLSLTHAAVTAAREAGFRIDWVHRNDRNGFKAGALANGLARGTAEFIAIFDADFVPPPHFLCTVMQRWLREDDTRIGFVQTRWDYLNRDESAVTRGQALVLDLHFLIEQVARSGNALPMAFNGSGGIWKRACIEDAGGWQSDTLTEDLDLSYRAQLKGWHGTYWSDISAPGDLPHDVLSYKRQQARWASGTLQTIRKLVVQLARSNLSIRQKAVGWMHLSGYAVHPLILVLSITTPLLLLSSFLGAQPTPAWINIVSVFSAAPLLSMAVAAFKRGTPPTRFLRDLPGALLLGIGVSCSNTFAMLRALRRETGTFERTPKTRNVAGRYAQRPDWTMWTELMLAAYSIAVGIVLFARNGAGATLPLLVYVVAFGGVWLSQMRVLIQRHRSMRNSTR
jgi:cellulose synthase/poly-beta-1,6-N-acetylglucosamine synthase-like glycosyltransferase